MPNREQNQNRPGQQQQQQAGQNKPGQPGQQAGGRNQNQGQRGTSQDRNAASRNAQGRDEQNDE